MQVNPEDSPPDIYVTWSNPWMTAFENSSGDFDISINARTFLYADIRSSSTTPRRVALARMFKEAGLRSPHTQLTKVKIEISVLGRRTEARAGPSLGLISGRHSAPFPTPNSIFFSQIDCSKFPTEHSQICWPKLVQSKDIYSRNSVLLSFINVQMALVNAVFKGIIIEAFCGCELSRMVKQRFL